MSSTYDDPKRRAEIDLLFLDIEHRIEQIRATRSSIGQLAADTELKRQDYRMADRRFLITAIAASATLLAAGAGLFAAGSVIWRQPAPVVIQMPPAAAK